VQRARSLSNAGRESYLRARKELIYPQSKTASYASLFLQLPFVAICGFILAIASSAVAPNGVALVSLLASSGAVPLPAGLVSIGGTALSSIAGLTLCLAVVSVVLSFFSREDFRQKAKALAVKFVSRKGRSLRWPVDKLGRLLRFMWSVTIARVTTICVFIIHIIHLVLLVAYGAILTVIFIFDNLLCPELAQLEEVFKLASDTARAQGNVAADAPENPAQILCNIAAAGLRPTVTLVTGEILFAIATACMLGSLGGTIAFNVLSKRSLRAEKKASQANVRWRAINKLVGSHI
jgi:hypothetical protein